MIWQVLLAVAMLAANAYFVAIEFALVSSRRTKLEPLAEEGSRRARRALAATGDLNLELAGAQLGITMASLLLGFVAEPLVVHALEGVLGVTGLPEGATTAIAFLVGLSIVVFLHMVVGEMVPKNVAIAAPERTLLALMPLDRVYLAVFRPVVRLLDGLASLGLRVVRVERRDELGGTHTAQELAVMLAESHEEGLIEDFAHDLLAGVLDFGDRTAADVMVGRDDIVAIDRGTTVAEAEARIVAAGHSRLPVLGATPDEPLGFVHAKDLLAVEDDAVGRPVPARLVRPLPVVRADRALDEVLLAMRRTRVHVALVADEAGRTAGLVTLDDLLEELVGDILDEGDRRSEEPAPGPGAGPTAGEG